MSQNPKLVILLSKSAEKTIELTKEVYSCGRSQNNDIHLNDPSVSTYHCQFLCAGHNYKIVDHNSTNGVRVNNVDTRCQILNNGDIIQIGAVELLYESQDSTNKNLISTSINISIAGLKDVDKMTNHSPFIKKDYKKSSRIILCSIITLSSLIIGLLSWLVYIIKFSTQK